MKSLGSVAAVIAAIREDAAAEVEGIEDRAAVEIARIRGLQAGDVVTLADRENRLVAARRQAQSRLAHEDWEDTREAVTLREEWLDRALALGQDLLTKSADAPTRRARLALLADEGLRRLPGGICEVVVSQADIELLDAEWRRGVATTAGRDEIRVAVGSLDGGCLLRTPDGRTSFDNSFAARAARFQATWRAALARLYEEAIAAGRVD